MGKTFPNQANLEGKFKEVIKTYEKFRDSLKDDFQKLLIENEIKIQLFDTRIKEFETFLEKVRRKNYKDPFKQNEDFCGFRIVSFYLSDMDKIEQLLNKHFKILTSEDKLDKKEVHFFGYRSKHYVAKLKSDWRRLPKFFGLGDLKFEVQVRTLNMHAWSEASHSLDYKNEDFVPKQLRRKLFIASAFLEQADSIFDELRNEINILSLRDDILTIHSLKRYLNIKFPDKKAENYKIVWLFEELRDARVSFADINKGYELLKDNFAEIEKELAYTWQATGASRAILDITNNAFFKNKKDRRNERWYNGVISWRTKLGITT